ncbi:MULTISPECIES: hypothetical protein [Deefgea]|uniref:Uncharacterized protein n=1 Tax=Deefgea chitinilytica TaxID=570276 RepID=A0ABS2C8W9_9NEIS|nr:MULTISPECIES: hypothetical protein [Deefgea]MBM5570600.1 hypothetical protein [Deefgea chitinilytica]MBM9887829.1 hypothetical protein [Deefgea sp. CFH1-16]
MKQLGLIASSKTENSQGTPSEGMIEASRARMRAQRHAAGLEYERKKVRDSLAKRIEERNAAGKSLKGLTEW